MKKSFLMLGLAVAAMSSCTNDEVIDLNQSNQKAIGFESFVNKGTRADIDNDSNPLKEFYVYGFYKGTQDDVSVFDNVAVLYEHNTETDEWEWNVKEQKKWDTQYYYFAAYADGQGTGTVEETDADKLSNGRFTYNKTNSTADLIFTNYVVSSDLATQKDFIATVTHRDTRESFLTTDVDLTFGHMLSKVTFKFENTSSENLKMTVTDVKLTVKNKATCTYSYNASSNTPSNVAWSDHAYSDNFTFYSLNGVTDQARGTTSAIVATSYVIPHQTDAVISFNVSYYDQAGSQIGQTEPKELSLYPNQIRWQPANIYNYTIQLPASPQYIDFDVEPINGWTSQNITISGSN